MMRTIPAFWRAVVRRAGAFGVAAALLCGAAVRASAKDEGVQLKPQHLKLIRCVGERGNSVFRTEAEWKTFWDKSPDKCNKKPASPPAVDFSSYTVIAAFFGFTVHRTDSVRITSVVEFNDHLDVLVSKKSAGIGGAPNTAAFPADAVLVPKTSKTVRFIGGTW